MPENSLKNKAIVGMMWTALQRGGALFIGFVGNIVLARLLSPDDYGCIGLLLVFTSIADILIDGGLGSALIQKKEIKNVDCSTIFVSNLFVSIFLFGVLFFSASSISEYFGIPILKPVLQIESAAIILRALYIIPVSLANRRLNFKRITIINLLANATSVTAAIIVASQGGGVWSLVVKNMLLQGMLCCLYWVSEKWTISFKFNVASFRSLFKFGSFIALSNLAESIFANVESFIMGRYYKPTTLGYYSQAKSLGQVPIYSISMVTSQVLFPTLSKLQGQRENLVCGMRKSLISITYVAFPVITLLCILAKPIIILLYTEKWLQAVPFLQMVCVAGLINAVIHSNFSVLKAVGKSNLFLLSQVVINSLKLVLLFLGMRYGVMGMLGGHAIGSYIGCGILAYLNGRLIRYGLKEQIRDLYPAFFLSLVIGIVLYFIMGLLKLNNMLIVLLVSILYGICYLILSWFLELKGFIIYREIIKKKKML